MKESEAYFVHESSYADEGCEIGEGTRIWHFSHVMAGAKVGKNCNLGQNVLVSDGCTLGDNVKVQNNVSIYTGVHMEDDVFCGPSCVFTNVINPRSHVSRKDEYRETRVSRGVTIGANSTIVCGVTLGEYCFIAAGAVVTRDVQPYALVMGNPARLRGFRCSCGEALDAFDSIQTHNSSVLEKETQVTQCRVCEIAYTKVGDVVNKVEEVEKAG